MSSDESDAGLPSVEISSDSDSSAIIRGKQRALRAREAALQRAGAVAAPTTSFVQPLSFNAKDFRFSGPVRISDSKYNGLDEESDVESVDDGRNVPIGVRACLV